MTSLTLHNFTYKAEQFHLPRAFDESKPLLPTATVPPPAAILVKEVGTLPSDRLLKALTWRSGSLQPLLFRSYQVDRQEEDRKIRRYSSRGEDFTV